MGMGYRPLTIFNEEAEPYGYKNILPVNFATASAERALGATADVGYQADVGESALITINQMFFFNRIKHAVALFPNTTGGFFGNSSNDVLTRGWETQLK